MKSKFAGSFGFADDFFVLVLFCIGNHCFLAWLPTCWADFSVLINELEGLDQSQVLIRVSAHWQVVDGWVLDNTVSVDDVSGSVRDSFFVSILAKAAIGFRDCLVEIWDQWNIHGPESSFFSGLKRVLHVWELGVNWAGQDFASDFLELLGLVAEGNNFGGADEGEVEWVEEEEDILSFVVGKTDINKVSVVPGWSLELRGWLSDQWHIFCLIDYNWSGIIWDKYPNMMGWNSWIWFN